ncbi:GNAT family N-acetyltransferase [Planococcus sp. CP5-4]|uniref:GNAT family N-acetyltransferase n=1 Tax=unclassified Planococcus (in: firmicutes) TaxID=2662419 RepID=UPI001C251164|nr:MULTISPECIES: GNAT family N-acetyltransferase [unclassified Planococcus (in: firmicutes)]MBU9674865.1 GNAT family N-acetyltransferase [Planococcus sp. CP5-4_YE]MBV0910505.1 GNAT family N-acetyltransferase [Planococcus sp. CP5-4_UN]MBW6065294.1 GNAT family N-acetyltransferase [Planococcus sp. CP5-4]
MSNIQFKRLASDTQSLEQFRELNALFADAFEEKETYLGNPPSDSYLLSLLAKEHVLVCTALSGGELAGGLVAYVLDKFEQQRKEVYIYDLAVATKYRRRKIATGLIQFVQAEAQDLGAWIVFVQADPVDTAAVKLYSSLGTREDVFHFDFKLEENE